MNNTAANPPEANDALLVVQELLADSLSAVYLHGSAVCGGLRPHSDVDVLVVVEKPPSSGIRKRLAAGLTRISGRYPSDPEGRRPLELSVFLSSALLVPPYPARSEFLYGEWLRHEYEAGNLPGPVCDPEMTLLLARARQEAKPMFGPEASELLPVIPWSDIRRAIGDLAPALLETPRDDERNVLLTLARMWRTLATGEFVPKDEAALWAAARLPNDQAAVLHAAREAYLGSPEDDWAKRTDEIRRTAHSLGKHVAAAMT